MLADAAQHSPDAEALVFGGIRLTYREYHRHVVAFADELRVRGVAGGRIATVMGNSTDTCITFFAIYLAGAQLVPLNPLYTARELQQILADADPVLVIAEETNGGIVCGVADELGIPIVLLGEKTRQCSGDAVRSGIPAALPLPDPDSAALVQYTGGTTGVPKGVQLTHRAIATNVAQREQLLPTRSGQERVVCVMPLFHTYALSMALYLAVNARSCLVVLPRYQPELLIETVAKERITLFPGSPTIFTGVLAHPAAESADWSTVRMCYSGSAPLSVETLRRWERVVGAPIFEGYGQTEAGPVLTFNPVAGIRKPGSVGVPVAETTVEVVDLVEPSEVLPPRVVGEIRVRGPQVMSGYRNRPEETAESLRDGWLYTGDLGEFDEDGFLFIRDRRKELVIVSGYNVYPREVEEVLFAHAAVSDVAVIGVPDDYRGEILHAYVVLNGIVATPDDLIEHCRANLARYKIPSRVELVEQLPKTAVNKTDKAALRRRSS